MQKIFNKDGFIWWVGVVEDRKDPEKLGRCRVRIFGYHTDNKNVIPTKDLPWAVPIQPITSAGISGIGSSPLGPVEGTWVLGFFIDGNDMQQPAMLGTISTKVGERTFATQQPREEVTNVNSGILTDSQGEPVLDGSGTPVRTGSPPIPGWSLGKTSEKYESGGKGPGTINDYNGAAAGDLGGASYGTYQLASFLPSLMKDGKARPSSKKAPIRSYISQSKFRSEFDGLEPATAEFDNKWREISQKNTAAFKEDQHEYIKKVYYDVMISNLKRAGYDMTKFGPSVQDLVWSTAVQLGPGRVTVFTVPLDGKSNLTDKDIVNIVSEYKIANVDVLFASSSQSIRAGVRNRYIQEKKDLLSLIT